MPGQKKSALTAATVQSANNNIVYINFNAKSKKSQDLSSKQAISQQSKKGIIVSLDSFRKKNKEENRVPVTSEQVRVLYNSIMKELQCPKKSVKMVRDILAKGEVLNES